MLFVGTNGGEFAIALDHALHFRVDALAQGTSAHDLKHHTRSGRGGRGGVVNDRTASQKRLFDDLFADSAFQFLELCLETLIRPGLKREAGFYVPGHARTGSGH